MTLLACNSNTVKRKLTTAALTRRRYATGEFEVTEERLGCYLPTEHIDNPKDYNDNKDARQVYGKLRPPVDPMELEIDPRTGMLVRHPLLALRAGLLY